MPAPTASGQPDASPVDWFGSAAGRVLLDSEAAALAAGLAEARGLPWLWIGPPATSGDVRPAAGRGLKLVASGGRFSGDVCCGAGLPLAGESIGAIVLQHVLGHDGVELLRECVRVLVPGGRLLVFTLNPLAPYRWRWRGAGLHAAEPLVWRRRIRQVGLVPEPLSLGIGPGWRQRADVGPQHGAGLRAAYLLRAEKRSLPLTPVRPRSQRRFTASPSPA